MKKILLVALLALFSIVALNARNYSFGLEGGYIHSTISTDDTAVDDFYSNSVFLGVFMSIQATERWSVQPEILYLPQFYDMPDDFIGAAGVTSTLSMYYIECPLLLKYHFNNKWSMEFGPQLSFLLSSNIELEKGGDSENLDIDEYLNGFDTGLSLGVSYNITEKLFVNLRGNTGFLNIFTEENDIKAHNRNLQISLAYAF